MLKLKIERIYVHLQFSLTNKTILALSDEYLDKDKTRRHGSNPFIVIKS